MSSAPSSSPPAPATDPAAEPALPALVTRGLVGGTFMGLANLVPGISGGTMLLAVGIYPRFIQAIADLTTLKFRLPSLVTLASVGVAAALAIGLLAGVVKDLVVFHRWVMYSLFIGLTLGGVPVVWRMARPASRALWLGAAAGFLAMAALGIAQSSGMGESVADHSGPFVLFVAGVAGASAMILPGVSGGYLLLVLGQYVTILGGIEAVVHALKARDIAAMWEPLLGIVVPVGVGVVIGVVAVSNLLKVLLARHEKSTLGVLLGLLVGAVVGLWPFQHGVQPVVGAVVKGRVMTAELIAQLSPAKYPTAVFSPDVTQIAAAIGLIGLGFLATVLIARLGTEKGASAN